MAYNIDHSFYIKGELKISVENARKLINEEDYSFPECNFLDDLQCLLDANPELSDDEFLPIENFTFSGMSSGWRYDDVLKEIAPMFVGCADILFVWEGGDSFSGLRFENGKITEHNVRFVLEE